MMHCVSNKIRVRLDIGFLKDSGPVGTDRRHIELECPGDFGDPLTSHQELEHLRFSA